jgi:hypothetical protein
MPGAMHSVDIVMANPGTGVVQCRVADHVASGGPPAPSSCLAPSLRAHHLRCPVASPPLRSLPPVAFLLITPSCRAQACVPGSVWTRCRLWA